MTEQKFRDTYRISSARLKGYDYAQNGAYFITICTRNRECFFGEIIDGEIQLSEIGKIAHKYWTDIPNHFSFVMIDKFIIMPNHIHGIIVIDNGNVETPNLGVSTMENPYWKSGNLGVIINQYKRICTINSRKTNPHFAWQSRFHDRIIRSEKELNHIREYIMINPQMWHRDRNNTKNL